MESRKNIEEEIRSISPMVADMGLQNPYSVPSGYFDRLPAQLLSAAKAADANVDEMAETELSPLLASLRTLPAYRVPVGYFDELTKNLVGPQTVPAPAKVIRMKRFGYRRLLAAAVVTGLVFLGSWFFFLEGKNDGQASMAMKTPVISDKSIHDQTTKIPDAELLIYLDSTEDFGIPDEVIIDPESGSDLASLMLTDISDEELEDYIDQTYAF